MKSGFLKAIVKTSFFLLFSLLLSDLRLLSLGFLDRHFTSLIVIDIVKLVQSRWLKSLFTKNLRLDPVWEDRASLVGHMLTRWNSEDVIEFCGCTVS